MSDCRSWYEIEDYAEDWEDSIKTIYRKLSGDTTDYDLPAHDTLNRVVSLLDPEHFEKAYRTWLMGFLPIGDEKHLCLDGQSATDKALDKFTELMIEKIGICRVTERNPGSPRGGTAST